MPHVERRIATDNGGALRETLFLHGVKVGAIACGLLFVILFTLLAPTSDLRARIAFLFRAAGFVSLVMLMACFGGLGILLVALTGQRNRYAVRGAALTALASVFALYSGQWATFVPEFHNSRVGLLCVALAAFVSLGLLVIQARATERKVRTYR